MRKPARRFTLSKSAGRRISRTITYMLLAIGSVVMIFPVFWMLSASFKPDWQILTQPPIWIPSEWIHVQAGDTLQELETWYATDPQGQRLQVITIGTRRYTSVVDAAALTEAMLLVAPPDQMTTAQPTTINGGVVLNVRTWTASDGTTRQVVALARDGDNLVVAPVDALAGAVRQMPLDVVNAGDRARVEVGDFTFQGRTLEANGATVIPLGPESQLTIVAPQDVAAQAMLVPADAPTNAEYMPLGNTELQVYNLPDRPEDERYIVLQSETWQPIINMDELRQYAFVVSNDQLTGEPEVREFQYAPLPVQAVTGEDGVSQDVVVLIRDTAQSLVIPVERAATLRLTPLAKIVFPFVRVIGGVSVRYVDDYQEDGQRMEVAIVGQAQDRALVAPLAAISEAFDLRPEALERVLVPHLRVENYIDALTRDLGGATFLTFFRNSAALVLLNLLGTFLSVTIVAYGFARLRAPGKNLLFMILLATMMIPGPTLLIPTYEIFQSLGMINTLWPLFIRSFFGNALFIFLLRQFFMSIPVEYEESARIDGANTLQVLYYLMLPLSKPALATIGIFTFWWTWNAFFDPYIYLSSIQLFTVTMGLSFFKSQYVYSYHLIMAASAVTLLPIVIIFFFAQRYFIEGIQLSGLKG